MWDEFMVIGREVCYRVLPGERYRHLEKIYVSKETKIRIIKIHV